MGLSEIVPLERVATDLVAPNKEAALRALADLFVKTGVQADSETIFKLLWDREALASTGVGSGVAIPHARVAGIPDVVGALAIHRRGLPFDSVDGQDVQILVAVLASDRQPSRHLKALANISRLLRDPAVRQQMLDAPDAAALHAILVAAG